MKTIKEIYEAVKELEEEQFFVLSEDSWERVEKVKDDLILLKEEYANYPECLELLDNLIKKYTEN